MGTWNVRALSAALCRQVMFAQSDPAGTYSVWHVTCSRSLSSALHLFSVDHLRQAEKV